MLEFVIDRKGIEGDSWEDIVDKQEGDLGIGEEHFNFIPLEKLSNSDVVKKQTKKESVNDAFSLENTYLITSYTQEGTSKSEKSHLDKLLEKSILSGALEREKLVPTRKSKRALKIARKIEEEKSKGKDWFNLPATQVTEENKNDLEVLKMRSVLDSKHFYKKNDIKVIPKYFQIGKVVEGAADFYSGRIPKSQRKKTLVDELLQDSSFRAYQKKKYKEIVGENRRKKTNKKVAERKKDKKSQRDDWLKWD